MSEPTKEMVVRKKIDDVRSLLIKSQAQIKAALPRHINADRFLRIAMTSIQRNPGLLECDKISLLGSIIQSAQLGLEVDGITGQAHLVPFWNGKKGIKEVQLIPGYRGLVKLARNSGEVLRIESRVVHEKDDFSFEFGTKAFVTHKPAAVSDPGKATHFYAIAYFRDGSYQFDVMTAEEVNKIKDRALGNKKNKDASPWATDYEEMGKKTVIRRLSKQVPSDVNLQRAVALDEKAELGLPQDLNILVNMDEVGTATVDPENEPVALPTPIAPAAAPAPAAPPVEYKKQFKKAGVVEIEALLKTAKGKELMTLADDYGIPEKSLIDYLRDRSEETVLGQILGSRYDQISNWIMTAGGPE